VLDHDQSRPQDKMISGEEFDAASSAWMANKLRKGEFIKYKCSFSNCKTTAATTNEPWQPLMCPRHTKQWTLKSADADVKLKERMPRVSVLPEECPVLRVTDISTTTQTAEPHALRRSRRLARTAASAGHVWQPPRRISPHCVDVADDSGQSLIQHMSVVAHCH